ncbi:SixA phosphatase family protein [Aeropyrum camini]|uniref:SixA phosphatase family protein n=1 Tax=Aeropyrum camini TaxID=229980 RepID=UPI0012E1AF3C|nr:hypothetical protein [Aeropyrum camini]
MRRPAPPGRRLQEDLSSPYRRAVETAEILARTLKLSYAIADWLAPDSGVGLEDLEKFGVDDGVILVGHNPWMEETIIELVGGALELKAGGFAVVSVIAFRPGGGNLLSLVNPGVVNVCKGGGRA